VTYERLIISKMHGYTPGEQPDQGGMVKLNTNENPYPASPLVAEVLAAVQLEELRRYPPPLASSFRTEAANYHGIRAENIIPTNGGDELLRLAITTFANSGDTIAIAQPSYSLYPVLAEVQGCQLQQIPLDEDWLLAGDFVAQLNDADARIAFVVNPHAPTGILMGVERIAAIAENFNGVLVVDEAYVDFVDPELNYDLVPLIESCNNLLILRTLSKGFSLAGLRFGYGIGATSLIEPIAHKTRDSYNTDIISQQLATAAIRSVEHARQSWSKVRQERDRLTQELGELGLACLPSQSNFLLAKVPHNIGADFLYRQLQQQQILVRYFEENRLRDKLRITVGTADENTLLISALGKLLNTLEK
jgi:histidinol-phosphate aminotransferase|tara:strand:- start:656 stop:1741 length:1086 start_codon:yes stop_codon:yes gene_type:complete